MFTILLYFVYFRCHDWIFVIRLIFFCNCKTPYNNASAVGGHPAMETFSSYNRPREKSLKFQTVKKTHQGRICRQELFCRTLEQLNKRNDSIHHRWRNCPYLLPIQEAAFDHTPEIQAKMYKGIQQRGNTHPPPT